MKDYYVTYCVNDKIYSGHIQTTKIKSLDHIKALAKKLSEEHYNGAKVTIVSWNRIQGEYYASRGY